MRAECERGEWAQQGRVGREWSVCECEGRLERMFEWRCGVDNSEAIPPARTSSDAFIVSFIPFYPDVECTRTAV